MSRQRPARKVPLRLVFVAVAAILVMCTGAAFVIANVVPWRYWFDVPETGVVSCEVRENVTMARVEVTNWSFSDRTYAVTVVVRNGEGVAVGSQESKVEVPSRHSKQTTLAVLTAPGGRDCEITKAELT